MRTSASIGRCIVAIGMLAIAGCTATTPAASSVRPTVAPTTQASPPPSASSTPTASATAGDAWLLVGRAGEEGLTVILDSTTEEQIAVPLGVPGERWGYVYTAEPGASSTVVRNVVIQPGYGGVGKTIDGRWVFPTIGADPVPVGVSADGSTLVLVEAGVPHGSAGADRSTSRFAVLDAYLTSSEAPRVIELRGRLRLRRAVTGWFAPLRRAAAPRSARGPLPGSRRRNGDRVGCVRTSSSTSETSMSRWPDTRSTRSGAPMGWC